MTDITNTYTHKFKPDRKMLKVVVVIDSRKLPMFEKHLKKTGYIFTKSPYITLGTTTLMIETDNISELQQAIEAANSAHTKSKMH